MTQSSRAYAFIFARGGSKGLPGKNIKLLAGKPLIAYSIEAAKATPGISRVIVSTDDEDIAQVAREWGAEVPFMRPKELAEDTSSEWLAWVHALAFLQKKNDLPDVFVSLPTTSPLRNVEDIERCLQALDTQTDMVITTCEANRSPWFNMVTVGEDGFSHLLMKADSTVTRRQDAPTCFDMTTVCYVARPSFILEHNNLFAGNVRAIEIPKIRAADIDTALDFAWVEFLIQQSKEC